MSEVSSQSAVVAAVAPANPVLAAGSPAIRVWPGVVIALAQWVLTYIPGWIFPGTMVHIFSMMLGPIVGVLAIVLWWLFGSRAPVKDRRLVLAIAVATGIATAILCDRSVPLLLFLLGLPAVTTLWVVWLAATRRLAWRPRRLGLIVVIIMGFAYFALIRVDGTDGSIQAKTSWRWALTAEQKFLAERANAQSAGEQANELDEAVLTVEPGDWPEFRGPNRDDRLEGVTITDDWNRSPPKRLWKHPLGPGWGSFTVVGQRLFTQEQRGDDEAVVCYRATDGMELWVHRDTTRFSEVIGGAGPRATPTFHAGRLYTVGANGRINCLDAATGSSIWSADMITSPEVSVPVWGYSSSPLVVGDVVLVLPGRPNGAAIKAYDRATGKALWSAGEGTHSYSSPQLAEFDGVPQVLAVTDVALTSIAVESGDVLWDYSWGTAGMQRVLQPYVDGDGVLICTYFGIGTRRVRVGHTAGKWSVTMDWESKDFKPYFNDLVVLDGYAYGFDSNIFCCLDLKTGKRAWKGGRYGYGQVLLVADQKLLLVLSETGEAVLLKADPTRHTEVCRFQALEGKTWNHPVIVRGKLYVRNAGEMACYDVSPAESVAAK
ncbi:MAG: hypothetical protein EXS05_12140 [Planctomycetaceae bacterium]|nr:hypothetical protein [Planctomycetaceae bacterium]